MPEDPSMKTKCLLAALALTGCFGREIEREDRDLAEAPGAQVAAQETFAIQLQERQDLGRILTDASGRALYLFMADEQNGKRSACHDACAEAWPPVVTTGEPRAAAGVDGSLLGTLLRADGSTQVTYNGWPLYYFVGDVAPGDLKGHAEMGFGAEWYLVTPAGAPLRQGQASR
jgi:predicted lipoprotein with Yx(FWY)xxD motif